jgi:3-methylcrotonyl-CoA carboxylase beta subunit
VHLPRRFGRREPAESGRRVPDRDHFGRIFYNQANMSAAGIAQIAVVMGSCTAGGAYVPAMSDESIIVKNQGTIFLGGPPLVKAATGEEVSAEDLGGGDVHTRLSGVVDHLAQNDAHALSIARNIVSHLAPKIAAPVALREPKPPRYDARSLYGVIPVDTRKPFDVREVIARIVDGSEFDSRRASARRWSRASRTSGASGRDRRQQRHPVLRIGREGRALHRAVLPAQDPARVPAEHHRLHGRPQVRERRHRAPRREDGDGRGEREGAEVHGDHRRQFGAGNYGMCGRAFGARFLWMWPNARISVMGGEQAASVLATVRRDGIEAKGGTWSADEEEAFKQPIRDQYERQGHPYYASARLWDDGVIDPAQTRDVLGLGLAASLNAPIDETRFGVFRM